MTAKLACELRDSDKPDSKTEVKFPLVSIPWEPIPGGPLPLELWLSKQANIITTSKKLGETYVLYKLTDEEIAAISAAYPPPKRQDRSGRAIEQPVRQTSNFLKKNQKTKKRS